MAADRLEGVAIASVCAWELAALVFGKPATITSLARRLPRLARTGLVVCLSGWLAAHFQLRG